MTIASHTISDLSIQLLTSTEIPVNITKPLKETTIKEGEAVTLECHVSEADAAVTWLRDGKPITASDNSTITVRDKVHKLTYKKSQADDEAEYTVKTSNDECTAKLIVQGNPKHTAALAHLEHYFFVVDRIARYPIIRCMRCFFLYFPFVMFSSDYPLVIAIHISIDVSIARYCMHSFYFSNLFSSI